MTTKIRIVSGRQDFYYAEQRVLWFWEYIPGTNSQTLEETKDAVMRWHRARNKRIRIEERFEL